MTVFYGRSTTLRSAVTPGELARFATVGVAASVLYFGSTQLLRWLVGVSLVEAATVSFLLVVAGNYGLHYFWTFRSVRAHSSSIPRFLAAAAGGLMINSTVVWLGERYAPAGAAAGGMTVLAAGVFSVVVWNYIINKYWVFAND